MERMVRLLVFFAVWKRPQITEICFLGLERLKKVKGFEIIPFAVISEPEMIPLCKKYGVAWTMHDNLPLGAKKNHGLKQVKGIEFDYLMEIGSDTLILDELLGHYKGIDLDFFGVSDVAFIDTETGACRRWISKQTMFGAGRMIKRSVLERVNFNLWPEQLNRGLDTGSIYGLSKLGVKYHKTYPAEEPLSTPSPL